MDCLNVLYCSWISLSKVLKKSVGDSDSFSLYINDDNWQISINGVEDLYLISKEIQKFIREQKLERLTK